MDGSSPVFYLNCAGGAAFHNLSHVRQTIQDAGFAECRIDDVSREMGLLSVQGSMEYCGSVTNLSGKFGQLVTQPI